MRRSTPVPEPTLPPYPKGGDSVPPSFSSTFSSTKCVLEQCRRLELRLYALGTQCEAGFTGWELTGKDVYFCAQVIGCFVSRLNQRGQKGGRVNDIGCSPVHQSHVCAFTAPTEAAEMTSEHVFVHRFLGRVQEPRQGDATHWGQQQLRKLCRKQQNGRTTTDRCNMPG